MQSDKSILMIAYKTIQVPCDMSGSELRRSRRVGMAGYVDKIGKWGGGSLLTKLENILATAKKDMPMKLSITSFVLHNKISIFLKPSDNTEIKIISIDLEKGLIIR
jgi:hypothetical protein